jgi:hypothetical protein
MAYNTRNQANNGFVNNINNINFVHNVNNVNNVNNASDVNRLGSVLSALPEQPLLLQVPQVYDRHRAVHRPHWQQPYAQPTPYPPQQINSYPVEQPLYPQLQLQQTPQPSTPSNYPLPGTPQTKSYTPQINEAHFEEDQESDTNVDESKNKKKKRGLRRRKNKEAASM